MGRDPRVIDFRRNDGKKNRIASYIYIISITVKIILANKGILD